MQYFVLVLTVLGTVTAPSPFSKHYYRGPFATGYSSVAPFTSTTGFSSFSDFGPFGGPFSQSTVVQPVFGSTNKPGNSIKGTDRQGIFDTVYEWNILDYAFESPAHREAAIMSGDFVPENNLPLGIDRWKNLLFITTPRWKLGTPATLSTIDLRNQYKSPLLVPYPDLSWHSSTTNPDCTKLVNVYRTFVDECDRLWIIDAGVVETLTNFRQLCPPKIVIFDLKTNAHIFTYMLPADQVKQDSLHSSIVVDVPNGKCEEAFAYVTDVWRFGVVVFSFNEGRSWRTTSHLHLPNPLASDFNFQGINFQWTDGTFGISLSPVADQFTGDRALFFHPMSSFMEFMVNTGVLKNETNWINGPFIGPVSNPQSFQPVGNRGLKGQSSTSAISRNGVQFFNLVQRSAVGCWDIRKPYTLNNVALVESDAIKINFPNDIKADYEPKQNLWVLSNYLPTFLYSQLDFNQVNFRVLASPVERAFAGTVCDPKASPSVIPDPLDNCV
uniref:CSON005350 protein n=1 Tax=Culicoides sonorensis TaxID=179676 RepID=A0A336LVD6_CULSO